MAHRPKVLVTVPLEAEARNRIANCCEIVDGNIENITDPDTAFAAQLAEVKGLLTTIRLPVDERLFDCCPKLQVVSNYAVGFDNVDVPEATKRGIFICNTPGVLDSAVADLTLAMILCVGRSVLENDRYVRDGSWQKKPAPLCHDLRGSILSLLGMGRIGRLVAKRARAFGFEVLYNKPNRDHNVERSGLATYVNRDELFRRSDYLSIHCPLSAETTGSVGAAEFSLMKPSAYLINTARGKIVDQNALLAALDAGVLKGAALDVMEIEPLEATHRLCSMPNVLLQPHVGSATVETRRAMVDLAVRNLLAGVTGRQPEAVVNPEVIPQLAQG